MYCDSNKKEACRYAAGFAAVSIIVPIYNAQDHIARCLESIRRQTYRNLEILLLNDGSQDVSLQVCQMYAGGGQAHPAH